MKAAITAAQRGHEVTLYEKEARLGGQALLAQLLPDRSEFGGLVTNLVRELEIHEVPVRTRTEVTAALWSRRKSRRPSSWRPALCRSCRRSRGWRRLTSSTAGPSFAARPMSVNQS